MNKNDIQKKDESNLNIDLNEIKNSSENNLIKPNIHNYITKMIKEELLYFKNDILKDMKESITILNSKYIKRLNEFEDKLNDTQKKSETCYQKMSSITQGISNQNMNQQRFSELEKFQIKANESLINCDFRIKNMDNLLHDTISKYDKIILDSILYPGIIGKKSEFQTFHDLIDFLLMNLKKLIMAKEKENIEKKEERNKIEDILEKFRGNINFCVNKVEDISIDIINYNIPSLIKYIEELKNCQKESKKVENNILKQLEENEKNIDNLNQKLTNNIKEKTQNLYKALRNEILDINKNMQMIQDRYNEYINDFELIKNDVNNNKIILFDMINKLNNGENPYLNMNNNKSNKLFNFGMNHIIGFGKINYKSESIVKQYIDGYLKISDFDKTHAINNDNNVKNILSDVEMDLTKNKNKYLKLNIKNKSSLNFDKYNNDEMNINNEFFNKKIHYRRKLDEKDKIESEKLFRFSKVPKIKQYNNLDILKENEEIIKERIKESNSFFNPKNLIDFVNINDDNIIHSKDFNNKKIGNVKNENIKNNSKIFLKKSIDEEKKNEEDSLIIKSEGMKISKDKDNKQINILPNKKNDINSISDRQKIITIKDRNTYSFSQNEKKETSNQKGKVISNNYLRSDKSKRIYSSKAMRENMKYKQMDINFDDERILQKRDNQKLTKSISQIKNILPYKDRDYFQERVQRLVQFSAKKPNRKNRSAYNNKY